MMLENQNNSDYIPVYEDNSCSLTWGVICPSSLFTRGATCLSWVLLVVRVNITASLDRHFSLGILPPVIILKLFPAELLISCASRRIILCWTLLKVHSRFTISTEPFSLTERKLFDCSKLLKILTDLNTKSWLSLPWWSDHRSVVCSILLFCTYWTKKSAVLMFIFSRTRVHSNGEFLIMSTLCTGQ